jgi:hypothetical protein
MQFRSKTKLLQTYLPDYYSLQREGRIMKRARGTKGLPGDSPPSCDASLPELTDLIALVVLHATIPARSARSKSHEELTDPNGMIQ